MTVRLVETFGNPQRKKRDAYSFNFTDYRSCSIRSTALPLTDWFDDADNQQRSDCCGVRGSFCASSKAQYFPKKAADGFRMGNLLDTFGVAEGSTKVLPLAFPPQNPKGIVGQYPHWETCQTPSATRCFDLLWGNCIWGNTSDPTEVGILSEVWNYFPLYSRYTIPRDH